MPVIAANQAGFTSTSSLQNFIIAPNVTVTSESTIAHNLVTVVNYGTIASAGNRGLTTTDGVTLAAVYNEATGVISGDIAGVNTRSQMEIFNKGHIFGIHAGAAIDFFGDGTKLHVYNDGSIFGGQHGVLIGSEAATDVLIVNSSMIEGGEDGVLLQTAIGAEVPIENSGTIKGSQHSILVFEGARIKLINTGTMIGDILAQSAGQGDIVTNNGTIKGSVELGSGADSYSGSGTVSGNVSGGDGEDSLTGSGSVDRISGGGQNDTLSGNAGNDTLAGDAGNDTIFGGAGKDVLTGGTGSDIFRYTSKTHSLVGANADRILDFDDGGTGDTIDVSAFFPATMTYRHNLAFTAAGQVRINDVAGADVIVEVNTGGTLAADFSIRLVGTTLASMNAGDFVL